MFSRIRPEPRLPLALSIVFVLAIGAYEAGKYKSPEEPARIHAIRTVIDAELSRYGQGGGFESVATTGIRQALQVYAGDDAALVDTETLDSLSVAPLFHHGRADAFSLSLSVPDARRCETLAAFPDRRVTRTLVNGHVVRDGLRIPSGYALQGACTTHAIVTLEISPQDLTLPHSQA